MLEVSYIGNHGVHLPVTVTQLNGIPAQYLSRLPVRDQPLITSLTGSTPNPFSGLATNQNTATTTPAQLLARFPQFPVGSGSGSTGVPLQDSSVGASFFESINVRLQKRFAGGITIIGNYIHSKMIETRDLAQRHGSPARKAYFALRSPEPFRRGGQLRSTDR